MKLSNFRTEQLSLSHSVSAATHAALAELGTASHNFSPASLDAKNNRGTITHISVTDPEADDGTLLIEIYTHDDGDDNTKCIGVVELDTYYAIATTDASSITRKEVYIPFVCDSTQTLFFRIKTKDGVTVGTGTTYYIKVGFTSER